jgi:glycosyltransferase involved in cell wall biosynthesis
MISVVLPVYNGVEFLNDAIQSVLHQEFAEFEFIIIDDCSTDHSIEIIQKYTSDPRIHFAQNKENKGLFATLNKAISIARGSFIKVWAQDDIMMPNCLSVFLSAQQSQPNHSFIWSQSEEISSDDDYDSLIRQYSAHKEGLKPELWDLPKVVRHFLFCGNLHGNISLFGFRKKVWEELNGFDQTLVYSGDIEFTLRAIDMASPICIAEKTVWLRGHSGQLSRSVNHLSFELQETSLVQERLRKKHCSSTNLTWFAIKCERHIRTPYFVSNALLVARKTPLQAIHMLNSISSEYGMIRALIYWSHSKIRRVLGMQKMVELNEEKKKVL